MLKNCKYRLPCDWCDKHDRFCYAADKFLRQKQDKEESKHNCGCDHDWHVEEIHTYLYEEENINRKTTVYICKKCGFRKMYEEII